MFNKEHMNKLEELLNKEMEKIKQTTNLESRRNIVTRIGIICERIEQLKEEKQ